MIVGLLVIVLVIIIVLKTGLFNYVIVFALNVLTKLVSFIGNLVEGKKK